MSQLLSALGAGVVTLAVGEKLYDADGYEIVPVVDNHPVGLTHNPTVVQFTRAVEPIVRTVKRVRKTRSPVRRPHRRESRRQTRVASGRKRVSSRAGPSARPRRRELAGQVAP